MYNIDIDDGNDSDDRKHHSSGVGVVQMTAARGIMGMTRRRRLDSLDQADNGGCMKGKRKGKKGVASLWAQQCRNTIDSQRTIGLPSPRID